MSSKAERDYIEYSLLPEILKKFQDVAKEYQQERDLGARGEFVELYRKARKLKTVMWDGKSDEGWREGRRKIAVEVITHALLMLVDLDRESGEYTERLFGPPLDAEESPVVFHDVTEEPDDDDEDDDEKDYLRKAVPPRRPKLRKDRNGR